MAYHAADHLRDVLDGIDAIRSYMHGGRDAFDREPMVRDAISTRLIQIGQAVKDAMAKGLDPRRSHPDIPWKRIAGMRDRLAHNYRGANPRMIWEAIETEIPKLETAVKEILSTARSPAPAKPYRRSAKAGPSRR